MRKVNIDIFVAVCVFLAALAGPVSGRTIYVDPNGSADFTTIQAAIDDPCTLTGDQIEVAPAIYNEAINFNGKAIRLYSSAGPDVTTIDGTDHDHVVQCVSGEDANTVLEGFTITGGNASGPDYDGGGMFNDGSSPTVTNCAFSENDAFNGGGGMYNYQSSPTVTDCNFSGNTAGSEGGGMYNSNSSPTVTNCTFSDNSADWGSGMYNENSSSPTVTDCNFSGNTAKNEGGGMYNYNGSSPTVTNSTFSSNSAEWGSGGGGMYNSNSSPTVTDCNFSGNSAPGGGGGMHNNSSGPTVTNCTFSGNSAWQGGAMRNYDSSPTVTNCTFSGNTASDEGGAMHNYNGSNPTVTNCTFLSNTADSDGGGMYNLNNSNPTVTDCNFSGNEAGTYGGGMYNDSSSPPVTRCTFSQNTAGGNGGGIYNYISNSTIINCAINGNSATENGGGMFNHVCSPNVTNCTFSGNTAGGSGGAMRNWSSSPTVSDCNFNGNEATENGGGMCNAGDSVPNVTNCTLSNNSAGGKGGGMDNYQSSPTVTNCSFNSNSAQTYGGGMYNYQSSPTVTNCIFNNNESQASGGGIANYNSSDSTVTNCTFSGNVAGGGGGIRNWDSSPSVTNCILWDNEPDEISSAGASSPVVSYSDVEGESVYPGTGNINADACFVYAGYWADANDPNIVVEPNDPNAVWLEGNYRLGLGSPCIDAGDNTAVPASVLKDLAGKLRYADDPCTPDTGDAGTTGRPIVDMGAYEFQGSATTSQNLLANPGFEVGDATGWVTNWGFSLTADTNQVHDGNYSGLASNRTASWQGAWQSLLGLMDDGKTYRISGWVRLENEPSDYVALTVKKTDSAGTNYYGIDNATGYNDQWVHLDGTLALDVIGQPTELYVYFEGPVQDVNFCVDDAAVTEVMGDMNHNGGVDFIDFSLFASYYGFDCSTQDCGRANLDDSDNTINECDLAILCNNWLVGTEP